MSSMDVENVRLLIPDLGDSPIFSDEQIETFLDLNEFDVYLAAADAIDVLASQMILDGGASTVRTDDLSISEKDGISGLSARASALREKSANTVNDDFQIVYPNKCGCTPEATARPCSCKRWC